MIRAIIGRKKTQICESCAQCVWVGMSVYLYQCLLYIYNVHVCIFVQLYKNVYMHLPLSHFEIHVLFQLFSRGRIQHVISHYLRGMVIASPQHQTQKKMLYPVVSVLVVVLVVVLFKSKIIKCVDPYQQSMMGVVNTV